MGMIVEDRHLLPLDVVEFSGGFGLEEKVVV
jgi:hypothetical protein